MTTDRSDLPDLSREPVDGEVALAPGVLQLKPARRGKPPTHLADLTLDQRGRAARELGVPAYRAKQLSVHYFQHFTDDPEQMSDLPRETRGQLAEKFLPPLMTPVQTLEADHGETVKTLWKLHDGAQVESVLMRYTDRSTLCISSEAGCGMNCPFCATGQLGLTRNLSTAEILEQVRQAERTLQLAPDGTEGAERDGTTSAERVNNIVFMGMGEPLANYRAVVESVQRLVAPPPEGFGMSARGITVSTVGLVPGIRKLTELGLPITLAVSLHAPDDRLRDELVPINTKYSIDEVLDAARAFFDTTGRRVSIEYALIRDINDQAWRADLMADRLIERGGAGWIHVNPIPLNPVAGSKWTASDPRVEHRFVTTLRDRGISTTVRDTRGSDIDGACGQLAAESTEDAGHRADREARMARVESVSAEDAPHRDDADAPLDASTVGGER